MEKEMDFTSGSWSLISFFSVPGGRGTALHPQTFSLVFTFILFYLFPLTTQHKLSLQSLLIFKEIVRPTHFPPGCIAINHQNNGEMEHKYRFRSLFTDDHVILTSLVMS